MFELLKAKTVEYFQNDSQKWAQYVTTEEGERTLKNYLTPARLRKYEAGEMSKDAAIEFVVNRIKKEAETKTADYLSKIEAAENAPALVWASCDVSWKRSRAWGMNPHAEMVSNCGRTEGSASGCGYDKLSAATAEAFNDNLSLMKALYEAEERRLLEHPEISRRDFIGYGSGTWFLPYFEGGVGESCHERILNNIGFTASWISLKNNDLITIERKA